MMINILLTVEGGRNMPIHLIFPQRLNEVRLKEDLTERADSFRIDYVSSGLSWLDACLRPLVLVVKQYEERVVYQLNLLAFAMERVPEDRLSDMEGSLREGLTMEELINRAYYFADFADMPHVVPVEQFHNYYLGEEYRLLRKEENRRYPIPRMTGGALFSKIFQLAEDAGDLQYSKPNLDYAEPSSDTGEITNYEFDLSPEICFGGSEGVYIDCYLHGSFDNTDNQWMSIGTIKTLRTDLEACKLIGALCGSLLYHESAFVNAHLNLFTPEKELQRTASWKGEKALCQSIELRNKVDACVEEALREAVRQQKPVIAIPFSQFTQALGWELTPDNESALKALKKELLKGWNFEKAELREAAFVLSVNMERLMRKLLARTVDWVLETVRNAPEQHEEVSFAEMSQKYCCEVSEGNESWARVKQSLEEHAEGIRIIPQGDTVSIALGSC